MRHCTVTKNITYETIIAFNPEGLDYTRKYSAESIGKFTSDNNFLLIIHVEPKAYEDPTVSGTFTANVTITITSESAPQYYPNQVVEMTPGQVYNPQTRNPFETAQPAPYEGRDGLSPGMIAAITISCVVVVVLAIVIIYFGCIKRSCTCSKDESETEESP